ncbi:MAG: hypothetical protein ACT4PS_16355 [Betaproteobacteria bacterium]
MWDAVSANAATADFEQAADRIRAEAVRATQQLSSVDALGSICLGESQRFHIRAALGLYHYINPKLLLITSAALFRARGQSCERARRCCARAAAPRRALPHVSHGDGGRGARRAPSARSVRGYQAHAVAFFDQ